LPAGTADLVRAVGGADAWRARVRLPAFDPAAAGTVVAAATRAEAAAAVAAAVADRAAAGLRPDQHPVIVALPVSIGRTVNEAEARASRDPRLGGGGHPRGRGLFGTQEQAQTQVLELAAAGADGLRVTVPDEVDVADLLAQVRSLVVGATPVLHARRR
jgi:alkanesulfonate monooxygenase SsuD/methylene tetrahydromethanopterin reductase-like flavin-dependent oxidoreductase (luciferase family)